MIMQIQESGITIVEVKSKDQLMFLASAIVEVLNNVPEVSKLVLLAMEGKVDFEKDLGIHTQIKELSKDDDVARVVQQMQGELPAQDSDIPEFVKRSIKENNE